MEIFIGLTAGDGYKTLLSHLGPDPQVSVVTVWLSCKRLIDMVLQEESLFLVTLGPKLPSNLFRIIRLRLRRIQPFAF
jgi:hypothetical protein